ncbi:MAG TPA: SDR family oxidoreductase [Pararhizobium sp.]|nr:SDR family oxidoreductase [Pararhizobium sp.]
MIGGHVVVTGGVGGIGLAVAERLLDEGASVTVLDADAVGIADCVDRFAGEDILFLECDVSDEDQVADIFAQAATEMGPVTGLVNCTSLKEKASIERTSVELFRQIVEMNLTGTFITCKAALEEMGEQLAIVNLAALAGLKPEPGHAAFGAAEAGINLLSRAMAEEFAGSGVRVNAVAADTVAPEPEESRGGELHRGRAADTSVSLADIASAVLFLLSDQASGINGHILVVDGSRGGALP